MNWDKNLCVRDASQLCGRFSRQALYVENAVTTGTKVSETLKSVKIKTMCMCVCVCTQSC